jgi:hypothetical protein
VGRDKKIESVTKAGLDAVAGVRSQAQRRDGMGVWGIDHVGMPNFSKTPPTKNEE